MEGEVTQVEIFGEVMRGCKDFGPLQQETLDGKWSVLILHYLENGPLRFNELLRLMPKMTHATLPAQLKGLVENGLVKRTQYDVIPPKVEYELTGIGHGFAPVNETMRKWGLEYIQQMSEATTEQS